MGFKMAYYFTLMKIINHFVVGKKLRNFFIGKGLYFQVLGIFFLRKLQKKKLFYIKILFVIFFYNGESQSVSPSSTQRPPYPTAFDDIDAN
jgi:hypothetical protein